MVFSRENETYPNQSIIKLCATSTEGKQENSNKNNMLQHMWRHFRQLGPGKAKKMARHCWRASTYGPPCNQRPQTARDGPRRLHTTLSLPAETGEPWAQVHLKAGNALVMTTFRKWKQKKLWSSWLQAKLCWKELLSHTVGLGNQTARDGPRRLHPTLSLPAETGEPWAQMHLKAGNSLVMPTFRKRKQK